MKLFRFTAALLLAFTASAQPSRPADVFLTALDKAEQGKAAEGRALLAEAFGGDTRKSHQFPVRQDDVVRALSEGLLSARTSHAGAPKTRA
jgi:hypothetical protein